MLSFLKRKRPPPAPQQPPAAGQLPPIPEPQKFGRSLTVVDLPVRRILMTLLVVAGLSTLSVFGWVGYMSYRSKVGQFVSNLTNGRAATGDQTNTATGIDPVSGGQNDAQNQQQAPGSSSSGSPSASVVDLKNQLLAIDDSARTAYDAAYNEYQNYVLAGSGDLPKIRQLTQTGIDESGKAISKYQALQIPGSVGPQASEKLSNARSMYTQAYQKRVNGYNSVFAYLDSGESVHFEAALTAFGESDQHETDAIAQLDSL